jgi:metal-responsive CopG/Arc/MetJ family transcriptional regulator
MGNEKRKVTLNLDQDTLDELDSIVKQDRRYWHRTHLINEALYMFVNQWEQDREDEPIDSADEDEEQNE